MHRSRVAAKGLRPIVFAVEGLYRALYATSNRGIRVQQPLEVKRFRPIVFIKVANRDCPNS